MATSGWRRARASALACAACVVLAGGCGPRPEEPRSSAPVAPAAAPDGPPFVVALLPERNVFEQKKRYQPIGDYLSKKIGRPVVFKLLDNYQLIFSEIVDRKVDAGFWGSMNGSIAQIKGGVRMIARPVDTEGVSTYSGFLFTRKGSGITTDPRTWRGKRLALVNKATTAGYLYPVSLLRRAKVSAEPEQWCSRVVYTGSHDAAIIAVAGGDSDLGACKNTVYKEYVRRHPEAQEALVVLAESAQVPNNALGVRADTPEELFGKLRAALVSMHEDPIGREALRVFQAQRFIPTAFEDYAPVLEMAREAEINLIEWPLREMH